MISDQTTTIGELKERVDKFIQEREWKQYHIPKNLAISITLEASELLEIFQWYKDDEIEELIKNPEKLKEMESELADVMIYCISLANTLGTNLSKVIFKKIDENKKKYPIEKVKGKYKNIQNSKS